MAQVWMRLAGNEEGSKKEGQGSASEIIDWGVTGAVYGYERFIKLAPQSAFTCPAIPQSQATHAGA